jgi:hypothetical protein
METFVCIDYRLVWDLLILYEFCKNYYELSLAKEKALSYVGRKAASLIG